MKINHLSVSRSQVWNECEQKYKFKYHLEIKEPEQPYFLYGKVMHKIMEEYIKSNGKTDIREIIPAVMNGDIPLENEKNVKVILGKEYLERIPAEIAAFIKLTNQIGTDGIVEWAFNYDLDPPNEKILCGFIDRLIIKEDKIYILDYKTTKKSFWRKDNRTITTDLQLRAYAMVVSDYFKVEPKNIKACLYYLQGAEIAGAQFTQATIDDTKKYLLNIYNSIVNSNPEEVIGNVGSHCKRCPYYNVCSFPKR